MILFICDFDNTLGDTYGPYGEGNIFRTKTLEDVDQATQIYEQYRRGDDDIIAYQDLLHAYKITDPYLFFKEAGMGNQLFGDVEQFLKAKQSDQNLITVILTTGDEDFQKLKTSLTGVDKLVDEVSITRDRNKIKHIQALQQKYKPDHTVFVDDRIDMTHDDFDFPITILEMDRKNVNQGKFVVHSLEEVGIILKELGVRS